MALVNSISMCTVRRGEKQYFMDEGTAPVLHYSNQAAVVEMPGTVPVPILVIRQIVPKTSAVPTALHVVFIAFQYFHFTTAV